MKLDQLAEFYQQLSRLLESGVPASEALEGSIFPDLPQIELVQLALHNGKSLTESLELTRAFPQEDLALISISEEAGRLPATLKRLAQRHCRRMLLYKSLQKKLAYPAFLMILASLILPLPRLFSGELGLPFFILRTTLLAGAIAIACLGLVKGLRQLAFSPDWQKSNAFALRHLPLIKNALASRYLSDYFFSLGTLTMAGVPLIKALEASAESIPSVLFRSYAKEATHQITASVSVSEAYKNSLEFLKKEHLLQLRTAEKTGRFDEAFLAIAEESEIRHFKCLEIAATTLPKVVYFFVVLYIAYGILSQYLDYFEMLNRVSDGG